MFIHDWIQNKLEVEEPDGQNLENDTLMGEEADKTSTS